MSVQRMSASLSGTYTSAPGSRPHCNSGLCLTYVHAIHLQVLLLQSTRAAATISKNPFRTYWVVVAGLVLGVSSAFICTIWSGFSALVVGRALQGAASAIYITYTLIMMVDVYPIASQTLVIAFFTAGESDTATQTSPVAQGL